MLTPPCWWTDGGWSPVYTPGTQSTPSTQIIQTYSYTRTHYGHLKFGDNKDKWDFISQFGARAVPLCSWSSNLVLFSDQSYFQHTFCPRKLPCVLIHAIRLPCIWTPCIINANSTRTQIQKCTNDKSGFSRAAFYAGLRIRIRPLREKNPRYPRP